MFCTRRLSEAATIARLSDGTGRGCSGSSSAQTLRKSRKTRLSKQVRPKTLSGQEHAAFSAGLCEFAQCPNSLTTTESPPLWPIGQSIQSELISILMNLRYCIPNQFCGSYNCRATGISFGALSCESSAVSGWPSRPVLNLRSPH